MESATSRTSAFTDVCDLKEPEVYELFSIIKGFTYNILCRLDDIKTSAPPASSFVDSDDDQPVLRGQKLPSRLLQGKAKVDTQKRKSVPDSPRKYDLSNLMVRILTNVKYSTCT